MDFRYLVTAPDLNAHGTLHGGVLLRWIDEATGMHARILSSRVCVTVNMGNINFVSKSTIGEIILIKTTLEKVGTSSLTFSVMAYEGISDRLIAEISKIVFVAIDEHGNPSPHGITKKC